MKVRIGRFSQLLKGHISATCRCLLAFTYVTRQRKTYTYIYVSNIQSAGIYKIVPFTSKRDSIQSGTRSHFASRRELDSWHVRGHLSIAAAVAGNMALVRKRYSRKQPVRAEELQQQEDRLAFVADVALAAEAADEDLPMLRASVKRKHIHWTHVRTHDPNHVQPGSFSRKEFWEHLEKVYRDVYPDPASPTGSMLLFGIVVKERHRQAALETHRDEHHHAPTCSSQQLYWNKIAKVSLERYNVPLNAVAHDTYLSMYAYVRHATAKKPLDELDAEPFMSEWHPRGENLVALLHKSHRAGSLLGGRQEPADQKRQRLCLFEEIQKHQLRSVVALQAHACNEYKAGRVALAEFCSRQGGKLEDLVANDWSVIEAPERAICVSASLIEKLWRASTELPCKCSGNWAAGAQDILARNYIDTFTFCGAVLEALRCGAKRGANVACIGLGGCGKSTLLEPLEQIFLCAAKPERKSTFPLGLILASEIILWQDYEHDEDTVCFSDLLSVFVGEGVGVRVPGKFNKKVRNLAPAFYSGRGPIRLRKSRTHTQDVADEYTGMMSERFTTFAFTSPIPLPLRQKEWPQCGRCAACFFIDGGRCTTHIVQPTPQGASSVGVTSAVLPCGQWVQQAPPHGTPHCQQVGPTIGSQPANGTIVASLAQLAQLHSSGFLDAEEYQAAKRQLLGVALL